MNFKNIIYFLFVYVVKCKLPHEIDPNHIYDVVIIGSGISGITSANELYNANITNFIIVEANSEIGGRVKTLKLDPPGAYHSIEFGANWIHGYQNNPLYKIAKNFNISGLIKDDIVVLKLPVNII